MTVPISPHRDAHVGYRAGPDQEQVQVTTLKMLLRDFFDGGVPEDTLVELAPGQGFVSLRQLIQRHPHLVEDRTSGAQVTALMVALLVTGLAYLAGPFAGALQGLIFLVVLTGVLVVRHRPLLQGKSLGALLRSLSDWPHRKHVLIIMGIVQGLVVVSVGLHARAAANAETTIDQALASSDPCAVRTLDKELARAFATSEQREKIETNERRCSERAEAADKKVQDQERCQRVVAAARSGAALKAKDVDEGDQGFLRRLSTKELVPPDLRRKKGDLPCTEALWPLFVEQVRQSATAWGTLHDPADLAQDLRTEIATRKLNASATEALKKRADDDAAQALKKGAAEELQKASGMCQLVELLTGDKAPAGCRDLPARLKMAQAQEEAKRKLDEQRAKQDETMCEAAKRQSEGCFRRCDELLLRLPPGAGDEASLRCEDRCEQLLPARCR